jgi:hypothetical protein
MVDERGVIPLEVVVVVVVVVTVVGIMDEKLEKMLLRVEVGAVVVVLVVAGFEPKKDESAAPAFTVVDEVEVVAIV